jgi:carbonic anhydrase
MNRKIDTFIFLAAFGVYESCFGASWTYEGSHGPEYWGNLTPNYSACRTSQQQSPINIVSGNAQKVSLPKLDMYYIADNVEILNNEHTIQINVAPGSKLYVGGEKADLKQFHLHSPSEEQIDGVAYPLDAHFVHVTPDGRISVTAVLFKEGHENFGVAQIFNAFPTVGQVNKIPFYNLYSLFPQDREYYKYTGSLTTPPCSDGVTWRIMTEPVEISREQIQAFKTHYQMNARPIQPLNNRTVEVGGE